MPEIHTVHTTGLYYPDCFLTIRKRIKESKMLLHCTCYFNSLKSPEYSQQTRFVFSKPSLILRSQGWQECIPQMRFACFLQGEWRNIKSGAYPLTLNEALTSLRPQDVCVWAFTTRLCVYSIHNYAMAVAESCKQQKEPQDEHEALSEEAGFECIARVC